MAGQYTGYDMATFLTFQGLHFEPVALNGTDFSVNGPIHGALSDGAVDTLVLYRLLSLEQMQLYDGTVPFAEMRIGVIRRANVVMTLTRESFLRRHVVCVAEWNKSAPGHNFGGPHL